MFRRGSCPTPEERSDGSIGHSKFRKGYGMTRTDVHAPSNFDPADYEYVTWFYKGECPQLIEGELRFSDRREQAERLLSESAFRGNYANRGNCDHCGAYFLWVTVWRHRPTNQHIAVGEICASERFSLPSRVAFELKYARDRVAEARQRERRYSEVVEWMQNECPDLIPILSRENIEDHPAFGNSFVADVRRRLWQYGPPLTERQVAALRSAKQRSESVQQEREEETYVPTPLGRTTFEGVVVKTDTKESDYGIRHTMIVKVEQGEGVWLCYVTIPNSILGVGRGDRVRLTAKIERGRDEHFGFGKRPTQAVVVARAEEERAVSASALD